MEKEDKKTLEQELEKAMKLLEFKEGKEVRLSMNNGELYTGLLLGMDDEYIYIKNTANSEGYYGRNVYFRFSRRNISAQAAKDYD